MNYFVLNGSMVLDSRLVSWVNIPQVSITAEATLSYLTIWETYAAPVLEADFTSTLIFQGSFSIRLNAAFHTAIQTAWDALIPGLAASS